LRTATTSGRSTIWLLPLLAFLLLAPALAECSQRSVQQAAKVPRIGFLSSGAASARSARLEPFHVGLGELGYVEGKTVVIEYRASEGRNDQLPALAAELVQAKVDVIVADSTLAALPAKAATQRIPIVAVSGDPVGSGLVVSLARPGGNVTGVTNLSPELSRKRLELLKEVVPGIVRIAVLWEADAPVPLVAFRETQQAARTLGLDIQSLEMRGPKPDLEAAFKAAMKSRIGALLTIGNPLINRHRGQIVEQAAQHRLPAIYADREFVDAGGLMSYGVDQKALYRRLAYYVDKILKGVRPAELPVEQPTQFELVINLKTAKALGLTIPQSLLLRADRLVE
jgi:ABC-type uncharacterized transport system substrate-binding protein